MKKIETIQKQNADVMQKNANKFNKKKIVIIIGMIIILLAVLISFWYVYEKNINQWDVREKQVTIEYGEIYEPSLSELVNTGQYPDVTSENTQIDIEANKDGDAAYYSVGKSNIKITHTSEYKLFGLKLFSVKDTKNIPFTISDTTAPVFSNDNGVNPKEVSFIKDCKEDITNKYQASDLSNVEITFDDKDVDYSKAGEYTANVFAKDANGNVSYMEVKVVINEPTIDFNVSVLSLNIGDEYTIGAKVEGKDKEIEWSSSDESVVKVDNGKITAIKTGKATIKARANGVEKTCDVTVKEKNAQQQQQRNSTNKNSSNSSTNVTRSKSNTVSASSNNNSSTESNKENHCTNNNNHSIKCGNMGRWFNSRDEVDNYWVQVDNNYAKQYQDGTITFEEYNKKSPYGYECWSCSYCGKWTGNFKYDEDSTTTTHKHTWNSGKITKQATCTSTGIKTYTCTSCKATKTSTIPALGHNYNKTVIKPTCTQSGYTKYVCARCNDTYKSDYQSAIGHKYSYTSNGDKTHTVICTNNCGIKYTENCSLQYNGEHYVCAYCKTNYENVETSENDTTVHTHTWDAGKITTAPTCTTTGIKTYTCTSCGATRNENVDKTEHYYNKIVIPATSTNEGYTIYECNNCHYSYITDYTKKLEEPQTSSKNNITTAATTKPSTRKKQRTYESIEKTSYKKVANTKPKNTSIKKLKKSKKAIVVNWKKVSGIKGYQIQVATDKKFKKNAKTVVVKKQKTTTATIKHLKSKKKYYVRIRTYKTSNNKKVYSSWSKVKSVVTK